MHFVMSTQGEGTNLPELYKIGKNKPFSSTLDTLTFYWMYPRNPKIRSMVRYYAVAGSLVITTYGFCCFLSLLHLIMAKVEGRNTSISEDVSLITAGSGLIFINASFSFSCRDWSLLMDRIASLCQFGESQKSETTIKRCNKLSKMFSRYCCLSTVFYGAAAYYESFNCVKINEEKGLDEICRTFMTVWLPFKLTVVGELVLFGLQAASAIIAVVSAVTVIFLNWECAELISLCFSHLRDSSKLILKEKSIERRHSKLKLWIFHHQNILTFTVQFNKEMKSTVGHISLIAALVFGCLINQATKYKICGAACELVGWLISLFLICDAGQKISDSSLSISEAIYDLEWYSTDIQTRKYILFILMRSQKPLVLDALPLGTLNYTLYLMMLKASYSFWTLLTHTT